MKKETTNNTKTILDSLMTERNDKLKKGFTIKDLETVNTEIIQTIAQIATYKTLKFLLANSATTETSTETNDNGQVKNTFGFDMSLKLLQTLYNDIKILNNQKIDETLTDAIDLVQVASETITQYIHTNLIFDLSDTVYTRTLKNGNEKNYTVFSLACKSIRKYITDQQHTDKYKKLSYIMGYTDNGTEILKPINAKYRKEENQKTVEDITEKEKIKFLSQYQLTDLEQKVLLSYINKISPTETMEQLKIGRSYYFSTLKNAKEKIVQVEKRIKL